MVDAKVESALIEYKGKNINMKKTAYFFVVIAAALWGTLGIFGKKLNGFGFNPSQIVFIRAIGATLALVLLLTFKDRKLLKIKFRDSIYFVGTGILSFAFFNWCYFVAINKTSLSVAAILLYLAPTLVMVFSSILFKEKMTKRKVISLLLTFTGCIFATAFVQGGEQRITLTGLLAGLGSALGFSLYSIFGRYALEKYDSMTVTLYTFIFASIGLIPITDVKGMVDLFSGANVVYYAVTLGLIGTVVPFLLFTKGLSYLESSRASIIATLEPIIATVIGIILYKEPATIYKVIGVALVIFGVYIISEKSESIESENATVIEESIDG